jgi:hypothetical protein
MLRRSSDDGVCGSFPVNEEKLVTGENIAVPGNHCLVLVIHNLTFIESRGEGHTAKTESLDE